MAGEERPLGVKVLAVSSSGGHWEQLMLVKDGFSDQRVTYAVTMQGLAERSGVENAVIVPDFNATQPLKTFMGALRVIGLVLKVKPDVVISTGAAPGLIAVAFGKLIGAKTIWIDSVANAQRLSLSGRLARPVADMWLTQWRHLAKPEGPQFKGAVL